MSTHAMQFSITLYGTATVGFTYLLGMESGLAATSGPGSDYGVKGAERGKPLSTIAETIAAALKFVPEGCHVCVHAPGTGRVIRIGLHRGGRVEVLR